ncbi:MAG: hypothetical protein JSR39_00760 [Verrucomicrobia bacterium]|nr:hypothetical protein [Verrucomicrobiota bacterium]
MATALTAYGQTGLTTPPPFQETSPEFQGFIQTISNYLKQDSYHDLEFFFHTSIEIFRPTLETSNELDRLLESYVAKSANSEDCVRALRLGSIMEKHSVNANWIKIAQAICYMQQGNRVDMEALVKDMVLSDAHPLQQGLYKTILEGHLEIYGDLRNRNMQYFVQQMITEYRNMASRLAPPEVLPFGVLKI